jgi:ABC-type transport system involved in multi-copper enzyme maturation permease subunit
MNAPSWSSVIRWLVRDTFLQARGSGLFWLLLGITATVIFVCLSIGVEGEGALRDVRDTEFLPRHDPQIDKAPKSGVAVAGGDLTLAFGTIRFPLDRDIGTAVRFIQLMLAWGVADTIGILLALVWTAGFMPRFLSPHTAPLVLAKPVRPGVYIFGKFLAGVAFVAFHAIIFFGGTWFALGVRTDVWDVGYFLCLPLMLFHFAVFYAVSIFLAVVFRSTVACVFGTLVFWFLCWGMNYGHHMLAALPSGQGPSTVAMIFAEAGYWFLPKPADFGILLANTLGAESYFTKLAEYQTVERSGAFLPFLSLLSSALFAIATLLLSAHELAKRDH